MAGRKAGNQGMGFCIILILFFVSGKLTGGIVSDLDSIEAVGDSIWHYFDPRKDKKGRW